MLKARHPDVAALCVRQYSEWKGTKCRPGKISPTVPAPQNLSRTILNQGGAEEGSTLVERQHRASVMVWLTDSECAMLRSQSGSFAVVPSSTTASKHSESNRFTFVSGSLAPLTPAPPPLCTSVSLWPGAALFFFHRRRDEGKSSVVQQSHSVDYLGSCINTSARDGASPPVAHKTSHCDGSTRDAAKASAQAVLSILVQRRSKMRATW